jgi:hypothetical protein
MSNAILLYTTCLDLCQTARLGIEMVVQVLAEASLCMGVMQEGSLARRGKVPLGYWQERRHWLEEGASGLFGSFTQSPVSGRPCPTSTPRQTVFTPIFTATTSLNPRIPVCLCRPPAPEELP